jgi:hypothetical protein
MLVNNMRTTIRLDDVLLVEAKKYALLQGKTFTQIVEETLREKLMQRPPSEVKKPIRLKTVSGNGLNPGIDLDDSAALLDAMEG